MRAKYGPHLGIIARTQENRSGQFHGPVALGDLQGNKLGRASCGLETGLPAAAGWQPARSLEPRRLEEATD